jgi:Questin oxidase-like
MLNRLMAGLVHPFIHLAYGFEFGLPGQVAEGLLYCAFGNLLFNIQIC